MPLDGLWVGPDGSTRAVRLKGGPLFEAFHGLTAGRGRDLTGASGDLARAYTCAVWAYRCIKLRADAVAGVPLVLLDRAGAPIAEHPLLTLLKDANPFTMNLGDLLRATEAAYNIWGAAYWLKVPQPGRRSAVRWLVWLNPQTVEPITDPVRGITGYRQMVGAQRRQYAPEEVIAFRNFDPCDDLGGLSPLSVALSEVNAELNAARYVAAFFANDARPAGLLTTDQALPEADIERVRNWWQRLFMGAGNKWRTGIVGGGLKWQTISFPPSNLALAELRAEDRRAICAVFGVPPGMAGAWEATTYATAREQKASFYEDTILPQLEYLAEVLNCSLLPHYPDLTARGARLAWDIDSIAALRETATDRARRLAMLYRAGVITRDEARAELGMPVLPPDTPAAPAPPPPDDGEALKAELARWERFALRRVRAGRTLRPFESAVIPAALRDRIGAALAQARTADEVRRIFTAAGEEAS
jgi:HK97 family phage portal protein